MDFKDYYQTLGVKKTATSKEIKKAYRRLARKLHPDVNPGDAGAEARIKEINEAHEVLSDPEKRRRYDELGSNWRMHEHAQRAGAAGSPFGGGFRPMSNAEMHDAFGGSDPFSDFFHTFFGGAAAGAGGRTRGQPRARRGRDIDYATPLSLEEAFAGAIRRISITHADTTRNVDVRIPAGVDHGSRVRVAGEGEPAGGADAGDLYLMISIQPHAHFERRRRDLYVRLPLDPTTAVLGGEAQVQTLEGDQVRLKIPESTQNGQVLRIKGRGMPVLKKPGTRGHLYATVEIKIPEHISADQRTHYEALRELERGTKDSAA